MAIARGALAGSVRRPCVCAPENSLSTCPAERDFRATPRRVSLALPRLPSRALPGCRWWTSPRESSRRARPNARARHAWRACRPGRFPDHRDGGRTPGDRARSFAIRVNENGSSPLSGSPLVVAENHARRRERQSKAARSTGEREVVMRVVPMRAVVRHAVDLRRTRRPTRTPA